jgi:hypothetical protein
MKIKDVLLVLVFLSLFSGFAYSNEYSIELRESSKNKQDRLKGFRNLVYRTNFITGNDEEMCDLNKFNIFKPISYYYDDKRNILFVNEYTNTYNIKIINLNENKVIKTIDLNTSEPNISILANPINDRLYISYFDKTTGKVITSIFNDKYDFVSKSADFRIDTLSYFSKEGDILFVSNYDANDKEYYLIIVNALTGDINKKLKMTDLGIKGEYASIRDEKEGKLLLEYRKDEEYENYVLYDPLKDKVLAKIDLVPWHVGNVYLDKSADDIIINDAKFVKVNNKKERKYTNKIWVYSFSKKRRTKEIPVKEGSMIKVLDDKIYLRRNNSIQMESTK